MEKSNPTSSDLNHSGRTQNSRPILKSAPIFFNLNRGLAEKIYHEYGYPKFQRKEGATLDIFAPLHQTPAEADIEGLIQSFVDHIKAKECAASIEPKRFTFGENTYIHIPETETFFREGTPIDAEGKPINTLSVLKIMKANFSATRTYYERIEPTNPAFFIFGDSARYKIIRAVQLHNCEPPVTAETNSWVPFFQFLSTGVEDHWQVQQQYSSCKWAAGRDEELAASQLLHYGWVPRYPTKMGDPCLYQLHKQSWGIGIDTQCPHTLTDRFIAACTAATSARNKFKSQNIIIKHNDLFKLACQVFFSYQGWYVSMPAAYRQAVLNKLTAHITHLLNAIGDDSNPEIPDFEEPENLFSQEDFINLKWEDFLYSNISQAQYDQRQLNNYLSAKRSFLSRWTYGDAEVPAATLRQGMSGQKIKAAVNSGILTMRKEGRNSFYRLNIERSDD